MTRRWLWPVLAAVACALAIGLLALGDIHLSLAQVVGALFGGSDRIANLVVWRMRLPYVVAACIVGAGLATSGMLLQQLTHNPLADSSLLGVNAGASLGAVLLIAASARWSGLSVQRWLPLAVILGACLALVTVHQRQSGSRLQLLLRGVALTAMLNGVILLIQLNMNTFDFERVLVWLSGSFWNVDWAFLRGYGLALLGLLVAVACLIRPLEMLVLGDAMAISAGVAMRWLRVAVLVLAIATAAVAVAVGGAISLVGLMAPNIAKRMIGSHFAARWPLSILLGIIIMLGATIVANNLFLPATLPVGLVVAVITMPYFLLQLFHE